MNSRLDTFYRESGAASVELIVGCLAALPLFFAISLLGKYADMRHKTVEAARYVAWEDVIWDGRKGAYMYEYEATDRLMGHRNSPVVDTVKVMNEGVTEDPLWRDRATRTLMVSDGSTVRVNISTQTELGGMRHDAGQRQIAEQAGLSTTMIAGYKVALPFTNRARVHKPSEPTSLVNFFDPNHYLPSLEMSFQESSAMLTDPWNAANKGEYKNRVKELTLERPLKAAVFLGTNTFGHFPIYKEGRYGANPDIVATTESLLSKYKEP